jgi:N-acetylmuramoyl-L-alanine amidase
MLTFARRLTPALAAAALGLAVAGPAAAAVPHTVVAGETLWSIAAANGMSASDLAAFNGLAAEDQVVAGSAVMIPAPGEAGVAAAPAASSASTVPVPASQPQPQTTDEQLGASQVGDVGQATEGMSRSLVQAVGWQESGFNNALVSSAGARGVMQIMPDTWNFIQSELAGGSLNPASAADNVRAGALYLHYLYHLKGTRDGTIAAYHQGPNRTTLLPETQTYLNSVLQHKEDFVAAGP